jgi:hypothetical protein
VRYRNIKAGGNSFGRQVLVARLTNRPESALSALHVFYKYLMPRFKSLMTDTQQTEHGQRFWSTALAAAMKDKRYHVYSYDRRSTPNQLTRLGSWSELTKQMDVIWGTDEGRKRTHVVISQAWLL